MPKVLSVVGQLLFVLSLTNEDLLHVAGQGVVHGGRHLLEATCHTALVEWLVSALGATLELVLFILTDLLVQLVTVVELVQAVEEHVGVVFRKSDDVAGKIK